MRFGFPYVHGKDILDPEYGKGHNASEFTAPVVELQAHVAALGMKFYTGSMFPQQYRDNIFIAEHGSWNRQTPVGYRIELATLDAGRTCYRPYGIRRRMAPERKSLGTPGGRACDARRVTARV